MLAMTLLISAKCGESGESKLNELRFSACDALGSSVPRLRRNSVPRRSANAGCIVALVSCSMFVGCAKSPTPIVESDMNNLLLLTQAIRDYADQTQSAPKSQEDLLPFLKKLGDPEKLLVSPRDGLPYVIHWGIDPSNIGPVDPLQPLGPLLAHEQTGKDGQRMAATIHGVMPISDEQFASFAQAGKKQ